jgi:hypothetical protein
MSASAAAFLTESGKSQVGWDLLRDSMIQGAKGHAFHTCMKKHDLLTRKTPKSSHFS